MGAFEWGCGCLKGELLNVSFSFTSSSNSSSSVARQALLSCSQPGPVSNVVLMPSRGQFI